MKRMLVPALAALVAAACLFVFWPKGAEAQPPGKLAFGSKISEGIDSWRVGNVDGAVRRWTDDSPLSQDKAYVERLENELTAVQRAYGRPRSSETINTLDLTTNIRITYVGVHLEKGPLFMRFLTYRQSRGNWIVSEIDYNVQIDPLLTPLLSK